MVDTDRAIIIFIKNPIIGNVKTRIGSDVDQNTALKIYKKLLAYTRSVVQQSKATKYLYYDTYIDTDDEWSNLKYNKKLQHSGGLGQRLEKAFLDCINLHDLVLVIGSDCPYISIEIIEQAFNQLHSHDFVIGPAEDGGYYLLGMRAFTSKVFQDIPWSTDKVYDKTIEVFKTQKSTYHILPILEDVDCIDDWNKLNWTLED